MAEMNYAQYAVFDVMRSGNSKSNENYLNSTLDDRRIFN